MLPGRFIGGASFGRDDPRELRERIRVCAAIGGSTNAIIHLPALDGRAGVDLGMDGWELGRDVPTLIDLMPAGRYLMEDIP